MLRVSIFILFIIEVIFSRCNHLANDIANISGNVIEFKYIRQNDRKNIFLVPAGSELRHAMFTLTNFSHYLPVPLIKIKLN